MRIDAAGANIWDTADQFTFAYVPFTGDGAIVTRVDSLLRTDGWAKAGVMMRESLDAGSRHASAMISGDGVVIFQRRESTSGFSDYTTGGTSGGPVWRKLERAGSPFTAYRSPDGISWTAFTTSSVPMGATVLAGLAVDSRAPAVRTTAQFSGIGFTRLLPDGWQSRDIPGPIGGSTSYASGAFVMRAAGADIWDVSDEFRYTYQPVSGDVDIVARVASIQGVNPWTKAGLMVRASLSPSAAHASTLATSSNGVVFEHRMVDGWGTYYTPGGSLSGAVWLKLERRGDRVTAFRANDGVSWTLIGDQVLPLPQSLYVGLALTSHAVGQVASATFDSVTISGVQTNAPPAVSLTAPVSGARAQLGASVSLAATASDSDGFVTGVDFLINGTFLTSDSSAPYSGTWTPIATGTFTVTANARDNGGAIGTSNAATVTIDPPPTRALKFTPSPDHAALVDSYGLEIFPSGGTTGPPILAQNLGKPAVVAGEISVDVTALIAQLPAGSYAAVVSAVGAGGTGRSAPSPDFTR